MYIETMGTPLSVARLAYFSNSQELSKRSSYGFSISEGGSLEFQVLIMSDATGTEASDVPGITLDLSAGLNTISLEPEIPEVLGGVTTLTILASSQFASYFPSTDLGTVSFLNGQVWSSYTEYNGGASEVKLLESSISSTSSTLTTKTIVISSSDRSGSTSSRILTSTRGPVIVSSSTAPSQTSASSSSGSKASEGAIAGGVVGGILALALIIGISYYLLRRRRKAIGNRSNREDKVASEIAEKYVPPGGRHELDPSQMKQPAGELEAFFSTELHGGHHVHELDGATQPVEMDVSQASNTPRTHSL